MKSADKATLIGVNAALNAALAAAGVTAAVNSTGGADPPNIITGDSTESETRPSKLNVDPEVTRTIRAYARSKPEVLGLKEIVIEALSGPNTLDLSAHGFEVKDQWLETSFPQDSPTDTGTEYGYIMRFRFELATIT